MNSNLKRARKRMRKTTNHSKVDQVGLLASSISIGEMMRIRKNRVGILSNHLIKFSIPNKKNKI